MGDIEEVSQGAKEIDYEEKLRMLELEKKKMSDEFDLQRAKLKNLFHQKENELLKIKHENERLGKENLKVKSELDEVRSQLLVADLELESNVANEKRKAAEEIASLQQIVQVTVDESSCSKSIYDSEIKNMQVYIKNLENENVELKNERQQSPHHSYQESSSLAPSVVLSAVTKKLARKLGADAFTTTQDDDHREDAELLRSVLGPLEEEIKALKDKLRATDDQLQKCRKCSHILEKELSRPDSAAVDSKMSLHSTATNTSFESKQFSCDMCSNYEAQLVKEQKRGVELEAKIVRAEKSAERHKEDLLKEIGFRKDMDEKWNKKKEEYKQQVTELSTRVQCCEQDSKETQETFKQNCKEMTNALETLTKERELVQMELIRLQNENDNLVGKYSIHSNELQSEVINLPDKVEELQELLLKSHQDLIIAKIGKEAAEDTVETLQSNIILLQEENRIDKESAQKLKSGYTIEINQIRMQYRNLEKKYLEHLGTVENYNKLHEEFTEVSKKNKNLEMANKELRNRVSSLQQELDNGEAVQRDFVKLSQTLQMQLEKIRDEDTEVRWQHEEDIDICPTCHTGFNSNKKKEHCRHCGHIFCSSCLTHNVSSGPNRRPSKVCDVCHTLLVKSSAPYFSTEAPHSPD